MKTEQSQTFETYNHRILWSAAQRNLSMTESPHLEDKLYSLGAMFLFFAAFEGYLNWLGSRLAPEVWKHEREFFSRSPYQGTLGKYRFLAKILCLRDHDPSKRPFQTATKLQELRDFIAHPKPEKGQRQVPVKYGHFPHGYQCQLAKKVSLEAARRARDDIEGLAQELHVQARRRYAENVPEQDAFSALLGIDITDT